MHTKNIQVQQTLFPEQDTLQKSSFVENYLRADEATREEIQLGVLSSSYMSDFIYLCYAMWMVENNLTDSDIDKEYLEFVGAENFKFFVLPKSESFMLKISGNLNSIEEQFDLLMKKEENANKDAVLKKHQVDNPDLTTEQLVEQVADMLVGEEGFSSEKWSNDLHEIFELRNRAYWIYTHMMEAFMVESAPLEINTGTVTPAVPNTIFSIKDFWNCNVSDMRTLSILRQKMIFSADVQKVYFNNIPLPCRAVEAILYISRGTHEQKELIRHYLITDQGGTLKFRKLRRVISALPYLTNDSLKYIEDFIVPFSRILGEADREFVEYAIDNAFIPEENINEISEMFSVILTDDDDLDDDETQMSTDFQKMFEEVVQELPEDLRKRFDNTNSLSPAFLNLEFDDVEELTKENLKTKILALVEKLESDSHTDIGSLSDVVYEWYPQEKLDALLEKEQAGSFMDSPPQSYFSITEKMVNGALKPKVVFTPQMQEEIEELKQELPNFAEVIDFIITEVKLNLVYNGKMSFTPILLLGDPGLGKTYVAKEIARILSTGFEFIDFGSTSASWLLKGSSQQWKAASPGKVLEAMVNSSTINPVILYDEIEKGMGSGRSYPPEVVLYQLFEKNNACMFEDEFLGMPFDASTIINICTANNRNNIPQPLQSRLHIFEVKKLNQEQTMSLAKKMYKKMIKDYTIFNDELDENIVTLFKELVPREIDRALKSLLIQNTKALSMEDLLKSRKTKLSLKKFEVQINRKPTIGF